MEQPQEIPQITLSDNKIVLDKKDIPLVVNGESVMITMQKLPAGDKREIVKTAAATRIVGQQVTGTVDSVGYMIGLLSKVIIKAPFPTNEATISSLPSEVLDYLFGEYQEWAEPKKKV